MSNVEFHRVDTSRGIMRALSPNSSRISYQRGRIIVDEFLMANAFCVAEKWCMVSCDPMLRYAACTRTLTSISLTGCTLSSSATRCSIAMLSLSSTQSSMFSSSSSSFISPSRPSPVLQCHVTCKLHQCTSRFVKRFGDLCLRYVKLSNNTFCNQIDNMCKTSCLTLLPFELVDEPPRWRIISSLLLALSQVMLNI
jgi:hypothetical protein